MTRNLCYLLLLLLVGCDAKARIESKPTDAAVEPAPVPKPVIEDVTRLGTFGPYMKTVTHDEHKFIVTWKDDYLSVLHSPNCPCGKKPEREVQP